MSQNRIWSPSVCKLTLVGLICTGTALSQNDPASPQTKPGDNAAGAVTMTRARQVGKTATEEGTDAAAAKLKPAEKGAPQTSEDGAFATLGDQITAATTPAERTRLSLELADQLVEAGMTSEAIAKLHLLTGEERFDPSGLFNIGNRLVRLGDAPGAIEAYRKAIDQRKGNYSRALNNLGFVLLQEGQWDQSYEALMSALRL